MTDEQRQEHNARRRDKRRTNGRQIRARHATRVLLSHDSSFDGDRVIVTAQDVIRRTDAMYGGHLDEPITPEEATAALEAVLAT